MTLLMLLRSSPLILALSLITGALLVTAAYLTAKQRFTRRDHAIIATAAFTATAHLIIGLTYSGELLLFLDGLGFFALLALLYLPLTAADPFRPALRWLLLAYTLFGFVAYFVIHLLGGHGFGELALLVKAAELLLIALLSSPLWQGGRSP